MNLEMLNDKRILKTKLVATAEGLDASQLFADVQELVDKDKEDGMIVDRTHPAKRILNKFSGGYISSTMVKGFYDCPANQLLQALTPYVPTAVTAVGSAAHSIFQKFYELPSEKRDLDLLDGIAQKEMKVFGQDQAPAAARDVMLYVDGFRKTNDYLDETKPFEHKKLNTFSEMFIKGSPKIFGVEIPKPIYDLIDRVDFRGPNEDQVYIIDYKTGKYMKDNYVRSMDGYLPQIITYKWLIEMTYGVEVQGAYLMTPGTEIKYRNMDVNSLENQSRWVDMIFDYCDKVDEVAKSRFFPEIHGRWCKNNAIFKSYQDELALNKMVDVEINLDVTLDEKHLPKKDDEKPEDK